MPYCSSCGLSLSQGAPICPACGSWTAAASAPASDAPPEPRRSGAGTMPSVATAGPTRPAAPPVRQPSVVRVARPRQVPVHPAAAARPTTVARPTVGERLPPWAQGGAEVSTARVAVVEPPPPAQAAVAEAVPPAQTTVAEAVPTARIAVAEAVSTAQIAVAEAVSTAETAAPATAAPARMIVVEPMDPDAASDGAATGRSTAPGDEAPPWTVDAAAEPALARRAPATRLAWTTGAGLARTALIGLVCLAAVLGFARGVTTVRILPLATGSTRPTLAEYRQLRAGQSFDQVDAVFAGTLGLDASSADGRVRRAFGDGSWLELRFSGGVLQGFDEHGLAAGPSLRVYQTRGVGPLLLALAGGLATAAAWWLLLFLVASWRGCRPSAGKLAVLGAAALAAGLVAALLLPVLLGCAVAFAVFLGLLVGWMRRDVAEALIVAAVAVAGGSLAVWLPTLLGLQLSALFTR